MSYPDIQNHLLPLAVSYNGRVKVEGRGFQAHVGPLRSRGRGWMHLAFPDPAGEPCIRFNYMSHHDDWPGMRACVSLVREIFAKPAFDQFRGDMSHPCAGVLTDEQIDALVAAKVENAYHPSRTCRIGCGQ